MSAENLVWMAVRRRGLDHHELRQLGLRQYTWCDRYVSDRGVRLPRGEMAELESPPCPRCTVASGRAMVARA